MVNGKDLMGNGYILWVKNFLCSWCQQMGLAFYDHRTLAEDQRLLERGDTPNQVEKNLLCQQGYQHDKDKFKLETMAEIYEEFLSSEKVVDHVGK